MKTTRLEAFSDAVIAIIMTIMVLEIKVPHTPDWQGIVELIPTFLAYILSFLYLAIYWNNHHHLLYVTSKVNGSILWANMSLLFFLSLLPFSTAWMSEHYTQLAPILVYGIVLVCAALSYLVLVRVIVYSEGQHSFIAKAIGNDWKGSISLLLYCVGLLLTFFVYWAALLCYLVVALMWLIPDRRIEDAYCNLSGHL